MSIRYVELDVEIRRCQEEIRWRDDKVDELEDEIYRLDCERRRLNPTEDWFLEAQNRYNDEIQGLEDEVDRLEEEDRQLRCEVNRLFTGKSHGNSHIMYSALPEQLEFQNGGLDDPSTQTFEGQVEENMGIQSCTIASNEGLSQEFIDPWDECRRTVEECLIKSKKVIEDMKSTPYLTPPSVSPFSTLGQALGLNVSKQASSKPSKPPGFSQPLASNNPTLGGQRGQGIGLGGQESQRASSKHTKPPGFSQPLASNNPALGGQGGQGLRLGGQTSRFRPLRIPEQQQGLDDTDRGNSFRPDRSNQHSGVFQKLLDGKLFPCPEERKDRFVSTQREQDFRPEISQNIESPIMRQDQLVLSSEKSSQASVEPPHSDSVLSSEQITDTSQEGFIPAISPMARSELQAASVLEQEELNEDEETDNTLGLDHDSFVIGDPPPPPVNEGLFGIVQTAKRHYKHRPTLGLKCVELRPHWICGAHQKRILFTWLTQKRRGCKKG